VWEPEIANLTTLGAISIGKMRFESEREGEMCRAADEVKKLVWFGRCKEKIIIIMNFHVCV
jgi:hypothetical protein